MAQKNDDVNALWQRYKESGDPELRSLLVERYLPLVHNIAGQVLYKVRAGTDYDDLVADGMFGLLRAIESFDLSRGFKFETYATTVVRGAIYNGLRRMDWLPERTRCKARALQKAIDKISSINGRDPTEKELATELQISANEVFELIANLGCVYLLSLDQPLVAGDTDGTAVMEVVDSEVDDPGRELEFAEQREQLRAAIECLNEREQYLIKMYYFEGVTFEKIANELGVSKQRVSQMHSRAVRLLREHLGDIVVEPEAMRSFDVRG